MVGIRVWFESGQDVYDFIIRQPEFDWEIVPTLDVINIITGQLQNFEIQYTPTGVVVDQSANPCITTIRAPACAASPAVVTVVPLIVQF